MPKCPNQGVCCFGWCFVLLCLGLVLIANNRNPFMPAQARVRGSVRRVTGGSGGTTKSFLGPQDREGSQNSYLLDSSPGTPSRTPMVSLSLSLDLSPSPSSSSSSYTTRQQVASAQPRVPYLCSYNQQSRLPFARDSYMPGLGQKASPPGFHGIPQ